MENSQLEIRRVLKIDTTNRHTFFGRKAEGPMYEKEIIENPSWEQVLNIVNLMGKDEMKNIEVNLSSDVKPASLEIVHYDQENSGLDSAYGVSIEGDGCYVLLDPEQKFGDQLFEVWIEGSTDFGHELLWTAVDYDLMLQATKFFFDSGCQDTKLNWWDCDTIDAITEQEEEKLWAEVDRRKAQQAIATANEAKNQPK
jgi:hypothetical protein